MMGNRKVIYYIQYALKLGVKSPICVSGGAGEATDCDVQRDFDGMPFIPGSSLAGALRGYLEDCECFGEEIANKVFGSSNDEQGGMSSIRVSDLCFSESDKGANVVTRDGIKLEKKISVKGAKFDMEAIDTGAECKCFLLLTVREGDGQKSPDGASGRQSERLEEAVEQALAGLAGGEIRLGANKNRGFGELKVIAAKKKVFSKENIDEWIDFDREKFLEMDGNELELKPLQESGYVTIRVPLRQKGGISIRRYSVIPGQPDYEHITADSKPVIPGSSWNGAIRSRMGEFLTQLGIKSVRTYLEDWFGYVDEKGNKARQSNVVISESVIDGGVDLSMTRTKINRYDASAMSGALYSEKSHFEGKLVLEIKVRKKCYSPEYQYKPVVGMLLLVMKDIQNGFLAVGGQTAVGRGIFEEDGLIELCGTPENEEDFIAAAAELCAKEKNR